MGYERADPICKAEYAKEHPGDRASLEVDYISAASCDALHFGENERDLVIRKVMEEER